MIVKDKLFIGGHWVAGLGRELGPEGLQGYIEYKNITLGAGAAVGS